MTTTTSKRQWLLDEVAYLAPMFAFLALVQLGTAWKPLYPAAYVARGVLTAALLVIFWKRYTPIRWNYWLLGIVAGVIGIVQWVAMQNWLGAHFERFAPDQEAFNPYTAITSDSLRMAFIAIRIASAVIVVPIMEELFWRDYLWRQIISPNDFKLAKVGEFEWPAFLIVAAAFSLVHGSWWPTAIVWGLMVGGLLVYTKSLGACIIMHAVTNLLLAIYVLKYQAWHLW